MSNIKVSSTEDSQPACRTNMIHYIDPYNIHMDKKNPWLFQALKL